MVSSNFLWAMFWLALLLSMVASAAVMAGRQMNRIGRSNQDWTALAWVRRIAALLAVCVLAAFAVGLFPYKWEYHSYKTVAGTVAESSPRFVSDGQVTIQSFAVRFAGSSNIFRCDDTRCALIKPGDILILKCIREYQWASTSGYGCNFVRYVPALKQ